MSAIEAYLKVIVIDIIVIFVVQPTSSTEGDALHRLQIAKMKRFWRLGEVMWHVMSFLD